MQGICNKEVDGRKNHPKIDRDITPLPGGRILKNGKDTNYKKVIKFLTLEELETWVGVTYRRIGKVIYISISILLAC